MKYQLNITLTEEDYMAFNYFHAIESQQAQKTIKKSRGFFIAFMVALMAFMLFVVGWDSFTATYIILLGICTVVYSFFFKKLMRRNVKAQVQHLKKTGKLPFDLNSSFEFYEDKIVEITPAKRIEQSYDVLERVCLLPGRYIFLYNSSVGAYILPVCQVNAQTDRDAFWNFISEKCKTIEKY
ncbi:MAG: hypothetical protein E7447_03040 [Ruminococcaceae bacterium]|nr:hypothetical protein [Oscillospiraceae bacterium]